MIDTYKRCKFSGMLCHVTGQIVPNVLKDHSALARSIFLDYDFQSKKILASYIQVLGYIYFT